MSDRVSGSAYGASDRGRHGLGLGRSASDRVVAGVAAGLADRLGVDHIVIRLAFVVLAFAGGTGLLLYLVLWLVTAERTSPSPTPAADPATRTRKSLAVALVVVGVLLLLRASGLWFGDPVVWPVAVAAFGSAVIWARADGGGRPARSRRWSASARPGPPPVPSARPAPRRHPVEAVFAGPVSRGRILAGGLLVAGGMAGFLAANDALAALRSVGVAIAVTMTGGALIFGPWIQRLAGQLGEERRQRIRSEERAEVAAHLHDSVLQSLALIQRASSPQEMSALARAQERDLRAWLFGYGAAGEDGAGSLRAAVEELAGRVERMQHVPVEAVVVGDCPVDERVRALVDAMGEATTNAARHAGASSISLYAEVEPEAITAFVRDQGRGFDPERVPGDRRGIAESIRGRMERAGGAASIESGPGRGTEVRLRLPGRRS